MHHPTDRIIHITAFFTPVVEHWLVQEIAQWVITTLMMIIMMIIIIKMMMMMMMMIQY